jgi:hypothetical protein
MDLRFKSAHPVFHINALRSTANSFIAPRSGFWGRIQWSYAGSGTYLKAMLSGSNILAVPVGFASDHWIKTLKERQKNSPSTLSYQFLYIGAPPLP